MPISPDLLSAFTLEVQTRRVEEYNLEGGKQIALAQEQGFFDSILAASGGQGIRSELNNPFPKPSHAPVQMLKLDTIDTVDDEV